MPSTSVAVQMDNSPQSTPATTKARLPKVTGRTKHALNLMVWDGMTDNQAAVQVGITIHAIRLALKQPHYRAYFREQCEMLRSRENPRNTHTLIKIRDQDGNQMARVAAIKELERSSDQQVAAGLSRSPGVVVIIQQAGSVGVQSPTTRIAHTDHITHVIDNIEE